MFCPNYSSGHLECSFDKPGRRTFVQSPEIIHSEAEQKITFFRKKSHVVVLDAWKKVLTSLPKIFPQKCEKISAHRTKMNQKQIFSLKKLFFLIKFLWTLRMENFDNAAENFFPKVL